MIIPLRNGTWQVLQIIPQVRVRHVFGTREEAEKFSHLHKIDYDIEEWQIVRKKPKRGRPPKHAEQDRKTA